MKYWKYLIIGIIQGLTEPLPISSSAHIVFVNHYLNLEPISLSYECIINFASTLAIFIFFFKDIKLLLINTITNNKSSYLNRNYTLKLIIASLPVIIIGFIFHDIIDNSFLNIFTCSISLIITGTLLLYGYYILHKKPQVNDIITVPKSTFMIGLFQGIAVIPGLSRSGCTLISGLHFNNNVKSTLQFSFFLYLIASIGAFVLTFFKIDFQEIDLINLMIAVISAFSMTLLSLKWFYHKLGKKLILFFCIYSFVVSTINLFIYFVG